METKPRQSFKLNVGYSLIQFVYWTTFSLLFAYGMMGLRYQNVPESSIGIITAITFLSSIVIQTTIAPFADRHPKIPINSIAAGVMALALVTFCINAIFPFSSTFLAIILYIIGGALLTANQSFTNAICTRVMSRGVPLNFSFARGIGSAGFALAGITIGRLVDVSGEMVVIYGRIIAAIMFIVFALIFPNVNKLEIAPIKLVLPQKDIEQLNHEKPASTKRMLKNNHTLVFFLITVAFTYMSVSGLMTYTLSFVERAGGNSTDFGIQNMITAGAELIPMVFYKQLAKKFGVVTLLCISVISLVIKPLLFLAAGNMLIMYLGAATHLFGMGVFQPASVYFVDYLVKDSERVRGQAFAVIAAFGVGSMLSNLISSFLIKAGGIDTLLIFSIVISVIATVCIFITMISFRRLLLNIRV